MSVQTSGLLLGGERGVSILDGDRDWWDGEGKGKGKGRDGMGWGEYVIESLKASTAWP